jgi:hypothetical protein
MDILYYSNYCPHSKKILKFITTSGLIDKVNAICIDKRIVNPNSGQIQIVLEDGKKLLLPPNVQGVPALLIVSKKIIPGSPLFQEFSTSNPQRYLAFIVLYSFKYMFIAFIVFIVFDCSV